MNEFIARLSERERLLLLLAAGLVLLLLIYALAWRPLDQHLERMDRLISAQQADLDWMQVSAMKIKQLRSQNTANRGRQQGLLSLVDQTVRRSGLAQALKRVEPEGADKVTVRLEQAGFDAVVGWLETLQQVNGVMVQSISVDRQERDGMINARLTLIGARQ